ncbi:GDSL esterase/lipase At3g48460-like [Rhodamnia argentea]|uniref:GDSL esterase/lipase At3g48460-like n=1 Tax=Rhodamnia argentea TaxID=178133 RepID=A0ABM3H0K5_9MYRT|nr:GDSL esterase/lipase At3g48460-like [Rhodamnia argentea]
MVSFRHISLLVALTILMQAPPSSSTFALHHHLHEHLRHHLGHPHLITKGSEALAMADIFSALYAFGESLTDTGNAMFMGILRHAQGGSQGASGSSLGGNHLCDGKLMIDFVCEALGIPPLPAFQNASGNFTHGANFAVAGSTALPSNFFSQNNLQSWFLNTVPKTIDLQISWFNKFRQEMAGQVAGGGSGSGSGSMTGSGSGYGSGSMSGSGGGSMGGSGSGSMTGSGSGSMGGSGSGSASGSISGTGSGSGQGSGSGSGSGKMSGSVSGSGGGSGGGSGSGSGSMSGASAASGGASMSGSGSGSGHGSGSMTGKTSGSGSWSGSVSSHMQGALFWIGGIGLSDYPRLLGSSSVSNQWLTQNSVNQVCKLVKALLAKGGKYIVVQGLPPCGCFPVSLASTPTSDRDQHGCCASANAMVTTHNELLQKNLAELQKTYSSATIIYADFWRAYMNILQNHGQYNFAEPFKACCGAGSGAFNFDAHHLCGSANTAACRDATKHMIWDGIHLTEAMNKEIAKQFLSQGCTSPPLQEVIKKKMG